MKQPPESSSVAESTSSTSLGRGTCHANGAVNPVLSGLVLAKEHVKIVYNTPCHVLVGWRSPQKPIGFDRNRFLILLEVLILLYDLIMIPMYTAFPLATRPLLRRARRPQREK